MTCCTHSISRRNHLEGCLLRSSGHPQLMYIQSLEKVYSSWSYNCIHVRAEQRLKFDLIKWSKALMFYIKYLEPVKMVKLELVNSGQFVH